jgi:low molecular weight phosphotyrosine protein phosphatase
MSTTPISVLCLCLGNICRSPIAHAVLQNHVESNPSLQPLISRIDSCGTGSWHAGQQPDPRSLAVLDKHGIKGFKHAARQLRPVDFAEFDYILVMDDSNLEDALGFRDRRKLQGKAVVCKFGEFLPEKAGPKTIPDVEDPYYGGTHGFETTYQLCDTLAKGFLKQALGWEHGKI